MLGKKLQRIQANCESDTVIANRKFRQRHLDQTTIYDALFYRHLDRINNAICTLQFTRNICVRMVLGNPLGSERQFGEKLKRTVENFIFLKTVNACMQTRYD